MPTVEERLAGLEVWARAMDDRLAELLELVNSGPHVPWEQSIRGKLHQMGSLLAAGDKLAEAAREVRRTQRRQWSMVERTLLVAAAIAAAVAPYVLLALRG